MEKYTRLTDLTVNYKNNPIGIETENIRFSWKMQSNISGQEQKWYRIIIRDNKSKIIWDTGEIVSGLSVGIPYKGPSLELRTCYFWDVTVCCVNGSQCGESGSFETGTDWNDADWITIDDYDESMFALAFRTEQKLTGKKPASARLYITAAGAYQAFINGKNVQPDGTSSLMGPGWTDVLRYINYQSYDVTGYISGDRVALGVLVGSGWYGTIGGGKSGGAFTGADGSKKIITETIHSFLGTRTEEAPIRERCLLAKLVIDYTDGTSQTIVTNENDWKATSDTPLGRNGVTEKEEYDARKSTALGEWTMPDYMPGDLWKKAKKMLYSGMLRAGDDGMIYEYKTFDWVTAYSYLDWDTTVTTENSGFMDPGITTFSINKSNDIIPGTTCGGTSKYRTGEIDPDKMVTYKPGQQIMLKDGHTLVLDFSQNAAAVPCLELVSRTGTILEILPGENISEGNSTVMLGVAGWDPGGEPVPKGAVNHKGGAGRNKSYSYTLSGKGIETYKSQFTFIGYRYLAITAKGGDVKILKARSIAVSSVGTETGHVETSNKMLDQFISNSKWSQIGNYCSVPTDCPTREYNGWTGDIQVFAETGLYHFDSVRLLGNYIEIMQEGHLRMGTYHQTMPTSMDNSPDSPGWTDAGVILPWIYYMQTGDVNYMEKYWDVMCTYTDRLNSAANYGKTWASAYGTSSGRGPVPSETNQPNTGWSDHLGVYIPSGQFTATVYHLLDNQLMVQMAKILNKASDEKKYCFQADLIVNYMKNRYLTKDGDVLCGTAPGEVFGMKGFPWQPYNHVDNAQTALAWMLKLGIYDTEKQRDTMAANLAKSIINTGSTINPTIGENTIAAGFLGVHVLLPMLSQNGQTKAAYALMTNTEANSFLYAIAKPPQAATTIWEEWVIWGPSEKQGWGRGSQNHYSYGASSAWLYEYVLGITKDENNPGFKHFILQPSPGTELTFAKGSYESFYGNIKSSWTAENGIMTGYSCTVPANTSATLFLPASASFINKLINGDLPAGVKYSGNEKHNCIECIKLAVTSGDYDFTTD